MKLFHFLLFTCFIYHTQAAFVHGEAKYNKDKGPKCIEEPKEICTTIQKPHTFAEYDRVCEHVPEKECHTELKTVYEDVTKVECVDVPDKVCNDVKDVECHIVHKPVVEKVTKPECRTEYQEKCETIYETKARVVHFFEHLGKFIFLFLLLEDLGTTIERFTLLCLK